VLGSVPRSPHLHDGGRSATQSGRHIESGSLRAGLASRWHSRTYRAALDREERAAKTYTGLMSRVGAVADTDLVLARQLAWKHSLPEAW
jgi:hypothetical protein